MTASITSCPSLSRRVNANSQQDVQRKYFKAVAYTRSLFHWLQSFCELVEPEFLKRHPKPSLPDELRPDVAPETITESNKEQ